MSAAHPPDGRPRKEPSKGVHHLAPQTTIRRICPKCLAGAAWASECPRCYGGLRDLVKPVRVGDFNLLDDEARQDLRTRKIAPAPIAVQPEFNPGDLVRYLPVPVLTGKIVRRFRGKGGDWVVAWATGNTCPAATENLERIDEAPKSHPDVLMSEEAL